MFREQLDGLLEGGIDVVVLETFSDLEQLLIALDEARSAADLPVIASLTFGEDLTLADGTTAERAAGLLASAGADVVGVNCGVGPSASINALKAMGRAAPNDPPRSIMPNAGLPQRLEGRFIYAAGAGYFAQVTPRMVEAGARIVGGCCGTTPEHIASIRAALETLTTTVAAAPRTEVTPSRTNAALADRATLQAEGAPPPTRLAELLAAKRFVVSVEIDPPRSVRIERTIEAARLLQAAGVDAVNVSDSAMAKVRMGAFAVAFGIQHDLDLECLVHCTTRDRNLMALESELLGAHALGVRNIIALTGDPPRVGDYPTGTGVWDVDSIGLIDILTRLNRGEDQSGSPIGQPAGYTIACALDPTAADAPTEWDRLERKFAAGAHLVMTQPLYSIEQVETMFVEARRRFGQAGFPVPVLLGVLPLVSARHAEFLHNEVPGITIPTTRGRPCTRPASVAGTGHRDGRRPAARGGGRAGRHVHHAELRSLRAVRRARPADSRAPPAGRGLGGNRHERVAS